MQNRRQLLIDAIMQVADNESERPRDFNDLFGLAQYYQEFQSQIPMDDGLMGSCIVHAAAAPACGESPARTEIVHEIIARLAYASEWQLEQILQDLPRCGREH